MPITSRTLNRRPDPVRREPALMSPELEAYALRFNARVRREVRQLMRADRRFSDLARVFPGAAVAIVTTSAPIADRRVALGLVQQGAPLKTVARTLSLPLWLRRLPPEAFAGPLGPLPQSETFARRVSARLPTGPESAFWLTSIGFAATAAGEDFALWLAEQPLFDEPGDAQRLFSILAAYAWFSSEPLCEAGGMIVVPWRHQVAFDTAVCAAKSWFNRMRVKLLLEKNPLPDGWMARGTANGYSFEPLLDACALLNEAQGMHNCADQYGDRLARDRCRLFSVRKGLARVATLEIGPHQRETGVLAITQLKGRHNMPVPLEVWQAAYAWMATQAGIKRHPALVVPERALDNVAWDRLMAPYRRVKAGAPWIADTLTPGSIAALDTDMADLARRGGVTSWLFT